MKLTMFQTKLFHHPHVSLLSFLAFHLTAVWPLQHLPLYKFLPSYWSLALDLSIILSSCTGLVCPTELVCRTCPSYWILLSSHNALTIILITGLVHLAELLYWTCLSRVLSWQINCLLDMFKSYTKRVHYKPQKSAKKIKSYLDKEIHTSLVSAQRNKSAKRIVPNYFKQKEWSKARLLAVTPGWGLTPPVHTMPYPFQ